MPKQRFVKIAGQEYELRYTLAQRPEIENITKCGLFDAMFSGELEKQAVVIWAGIKHTNRRLTPAHVIDLLSKHQEMDEDASYSDDIMRPAFRAVFESRLLGRFDEAQLRKLLGEDDEGKAEPQG